MADPILDVFTAEYMAAYRTADPAAVAAHYADDARWVAAAGLVIDGRAAIEALLTALLAVLPPDLRLTEEDRLVLGDVAVSRGTYAMSDADGGEPVIGGAYLNLLRSTGGRWRIVAQQMNYAVPMTPEMWVGTRPPGGPGAAPQAVDPGDPAAMAERFDDEAWVALAGRPPVTGREAIAASLREVVDAAAHLTVHDLVTHELPEGWEVDVGWFELAGPGERTWWGTHTVLARRQASADRSIHWLVATASPWSAEV